MKNRRLFLFATLFLFTLLGVPRFVAAVTLLHDVTSNVTGLVNNGCVVPPLVSAFSTASPQVWVYFDFVGSAVGDTVTTTFYRPDGVSYANFNATITGTGSGGFGCYAYFTNISGANAASFPGTWTVKVTYNGSSTPLFSLNFTVTSASVLSVSATQLNFSTGVGVNSAIQTFQVQATGSSALSWTASASTTSGGNWLVVSPASGTTTSTVSVSINAAAVTPGNYTGAISVASSAAPNSPQTVAVQLAVSSGPVVTVTSASKSQVALSWDTISGAGSYVVQRRAVSDGGYAPGGTTVSTTTYTDTTIDAFTIYVYRVFAISNGNAGGASNEVTVGPPPPGFNMIAPASKAVAAKQNLAYAYGIENSLTVDGNGDPALEFAYANGASFSGGGVYTDIYFVGWDRVHYQWKTPVKIDTMPCDCDFIPEISLAYDSSTNLFGVAYEDDLNSVVWIAFSSDGGATWNKQQVYSTPFSLGSGGVTLQMANGQASLVAGANPGPVYYITGAETAAPSSWTKTNAPITTIPGSSTGFQCIYSLALDSSGKPGVVLQCADPSGLGTVYFWRPPATTAVKIMTNNGFTQSARDIRVAFFGTNPRILSHIFRNNLGGTIVNGVYLTDLWTSASSDGGTTWGTPVQLPDDGNQTLQFPITLAVGPQGQVAVSAYDNGGNQDKVLCGWPKLIRSSDQVTWTHCNPGNSPAPVVSDNWESAAFAPNGKLYLAFQNYSPAYFQPGGFNDLPAGVVLWREAPQPSNLPAPVVNTGGVINNAGETAGKPVAPGSIIEVYGANLGALAYSSIVPLVNTLGATPALTTSVLINGIPAPIYFTSSGQIDLQMPFEVTNVSAGLPTVGPNAGIQVTVNDSISPLLPFTFSAFEPGIYAAINVNGTVNPSGGSAKVGDVLTVYMTGLGITTNQPADGAPSPGGPNLATSQGTATATIGGVSAPVLFAGLTPGNVGLYQVNVQVPSLAAGTYPLVIAVGGVANANKISITVSGSSTSRVNPR